MGYRCDTRNTTHGAPVGLTDTHVELHVSKLLSLETHPEHGATLRFVDPQNQVFHVHAAETQFFALGEMITALTAVLRHTQRPAV